LTGRLDALAMNATLDGTGLALGETRFERVRASASGPLRAPRVTAQVRGPGMPEVAASATVRARAGGIAVDRVEVQASRDGQTISARATSFAIGERTIELPNLVVLGAGAPIDASLKIQNDRVTVQAHATDAKLDRITAALGVTSPVEGGSVSFDI